MISIGPELPPHLLAKRKRQQEEESVGAVVDTTPKRPTSRSSSTESASKRKRILGPAAPPAPLEQRPADVSTPGDESSSSDDDYGPVIPSEAAKYKGVVEENETWDTVRQTSVKSEEATKKSGRDEWMLIPPTQDDLSARIDPTKIRARKFNTGKGAKGSGQAGVDNSMWTETPEQKRKRLRDQVLGVQEDTSTTHMESVAAARKRQDDEEKGRKIREYDAKYRGKSLVEQHQGLAVKEKEDDPTKRAFDYEKDMGSGAKIGHAQKREMLKRAADLGSKFSSGSFL